MTQEEKQLILTDLCGRFPYGVKVKVEEVSYPVEFDIQMLSEMKNNNWYEYPKPYLRTMISITVEERYELYKLLFDICSIHYIDHVINNCVNISPLYDWLNKKMFDYRGLIPKGAALEAPDEMYKEK